MFGQVMNVGWEDFTITLRPFKKEEVGEMAEKFSSAKVHQHTMQIFGFTKEQEEEWFENNIKDKSQVTWCIVPKGEDKPVGVTGLHRIDLNQSCTSGIIIYDPEWWNKGVATRAHIARTWYAAKKLDRATIQSEVMIPNEASKRALERVGYTVTGKMIKRVRVGSKYVDTYVFSWINPIWVPRLFPNGVPKELQKGIQRAKETLEKAKEVIELP